MKSDPDMVMTDEEWKNRTLCSDGNCIGVIGPDGLCKECKKPYEGELKDPAPVRAEQDAGTHATEDENKDKNDAFYDDSEKDDDQSKDDNQYDDDENDKEIISDKEWENRTLCSDGNCIGVIGPDGLCKECKKPFKDD